MLEMGARFSEDIFIKVSYDPDLDSGIVTLIRGRGDEATDATDEFSFGIE